MEEFKNQNDENNFNTRPQPPPYSSVLVNPIITQQPGTVYLQTVHVGPNPLLVNCPQCKGTTITSIEYETTTRTHVTAALLCIFGFWPCLWIPYCTPCCMNTTHNCSHCGAFIGTYRN